MAVCRFFMMASCEMGAIRRGYDQSDAPPNHDIGESPSSSRPRGRWAVSRRGDGSGRKTPPHHLRHRVVVARCATREKMRRTVGRRASRRVRAVVTNYASVVARVQTAAKKRSPIPQHAMRMHFAHSRARARIPTRRRRPSTLGDRAGVREASDQISGTSKRCCIEKWLNTASRWTSMLSSTGRGEIVRRLIPDAPTTRRPSAVSATPPRRRRRPNYFPIPRVAGYLRDHVIHAWQRTTREKMDGGSSVRPPPASSRELFRFRDSSRGSFLNVGIPGVVIGFVSAKHRSMVDAPRVHVAERVP